MAEMEKPLRLIVKEKLVEHSLSLVIAPLTLLAGTLYWVVSPILLSLLWSRLEPQVLQRVLGLALLSIVVLLAYVIYLQRKFSGRLRIMFGVKWDRDATPHCPACDTPLSAYTRRSAFSGSEGHWSFRCLKCKTEISLFDDSGERITLAEAKLRLSRASR